MNLSSAVAGGWSYPPPPLVTTLFPMVHVQTFNDDISLLLDVIYVMEEMCNYREEEGGSRTYRARIRP
jgi:hypothetical protein